MEELIDALHRLSTRCPELNEIVKVRILYAPLNGGDIGKHVFDTLPTSQEVNAQKQALSQEGTVVASVASAIRFNDVC